MKNKIVKSIGICVAIVAMSFLPIVQSSAAAAYDSDYTKTYTFENLIKPALTNQYTNEQGIYRQLELAFRYRVLTQGEVLDLYDLGYTVPVGVLAKLYNAGYINGYVYHRATGSAITMDDMKDVFDAEYYYNAYPDLQKAYGYDESALFNHFMTSGMSEGRRGSLSFDPVYFKNTYKDVADELGDDMSLYYIHYILHGVELGLNGSSDVQGTRADVLSNFDN